MDIRNHCFDIRNRHVGVDCQFGLKGGLLSSHMSAQQNEVNAR
jgi:hypothetical protein